MSARASEAETAGLPAARRPAGRAGRPADGWPPLADVPGGRNLGLLSATAVSGAGEAELSRGGRAQQPEQLREQRLKLCIVQCVVHYNSCIAQPDRGTVA